MIMSSEKHITNNTSQITDRCYRVIASSWTISKATSCML